MMAKLRFLKKSILCIMVMLLLFGTSMTVFAEPGDDTDTGSEKSSSDLEKLSFASMTEAAATYLSSALSPEGDGAKLLPDNDAAEKKWTNAGGVAGYSSSTEGFSDWLLSHITMASQNAAYSSYKGLVRSDSDKTNAVFYYVNYGRILELLGFDRTGYQYGANGAYVQGYLLAGAYALSSVVPAIMSGVIGFLKVMNPFQFFSTDDGSFGNIISGVVGTSPLLDGIRRALQPTFEIIAGMGFSLFLPLYVVGLIAELYLFKKTKASAAIKKFTLRLCSIALMIPLLGATYTQILKYMGENISTATSASTEAVYSILIDFKSWAEKGNLQLPSGYNIKITGIDSPTPSVDSESVLNSRGMCLTLNSIYSNTNLNAVKQTDDSIESALNFNTNFFEQHASKSESMFGSTMGLILNYAKGTKYRASDFEATVKSSMSGSDNMTSNRASVSIMGKLFTATNEYKDWNSLADNDDDIEDLPLKASDILSTEFASDGRIINVVNIWGNGDSGMNASLVDGNNILYTGSSGAPFTSGVALDTIMDAGDYGGLSTMSMYNYLNTSFDDGSLTVYSADATSDFTRQSHYTVSLIGANGIQQFAYYINTMSLMVCFIIIGVFYAIAMIANVISRSMRLIMAVPMMLLGSIKAMGQVIVYTLVMITQILGTMLMYDLMTKLLLAVNGILTIPMLSTASITSTMLGGKFVVGAVAASIYPVLLFFGSIFQLMFAFVALKERKKFVKGLEEASERIIDNLLGTKTGVNTGANLAEKGVKAAAGAIGMAGAAGLMQGKNNDGPDEDQDNHLAHTKNPDADSELHSENDPSATGGGGGNDSKGIEGEERARIAEKQQAIEGEDQKRLEDKGGAGEENPNGPQPVDGDPNDPDDPDNPDTSNELSDKSAQGTSDSTTKADSHDKSSSKGKTNSSMASSNSTKGSPKLTDEEIAAKALSASNIKDALKVVGNNGTNNSSSPAMDTHTSSVSSPSAIASPTGGDTTGIEDVVSDTTEQMPEQTDISADADASPQVDTQSQTLSESAVAMRKNLELAQKTGSPQVLANASSVSSSSSVPNVRQQASVKSGQQSVTNRQVSVNPQVPSQSVNSSNVDKKRMELQNAQNRFNQAKRNAQNKATNRTNIRRAAAIYAVTSLTTGDADKAMQMSMMGLQQSTNNNANRLAEMRQTELLNNQSNNAIIDRSIANNTDDSTLISSMDRAIKDLDNATTKIKTPPKYNPTGKIIKPLGNDNADGVITS